MNFSYRNKFLILASVWVLLILVLTVFFRPWLINRQTIVTAKALESRKKLMEQQAQQENFKKAQMSMEALKGKPVPVEELLPSEGSLVSELSLLESWADQLSLSIKTQLSGSVASAKKADTRTSIALVPLSLGIAGETSKVMDFLAFLENSSLPFVVERTTISVNGSNKDGGVTMSLEGNVYVKR
jgi:competence protein ComGC